MSQLTLKTIIYAEDESDIRDIAQIALEDIGAFEVTYCEHGRAVLEASNTLVPDLLLLDVMMPEMDGPGVLSELRKNPAFSQVPAIFMTAKIQSNELEAYKSLGVVDVIAKPFDPMTLSEKINTIWNTYHGC